MFLISFKTMDINLKSITVENFKGFQSEKTFDFQKLTVLTGSNNSGKSSVLQAILGALQSTKFPLNFSTNGEYTSMGDFFDISYRHKRKNVVKINFKFERLNGKIIDKTIVNTEWIEDKQNKLPLLSSLKANTDFFNLYIRKDGNKYLLDYNYLPDKNPITSGLKKDTFLKLISTLTDIIEKDANKSQTKDETITVLNSQLFEPFSVTDFPINHFENLEKTYPNKNIQFSQSLIFIIDIFTSFSRNANLISSFRHHPNRTYLEQPQHFTKVKKFGEGYLDQIIAWQDKDEKKFKELNLAAQKLSLFESINSKRIKGAKFETLIKPHKKGVESIISDVGFGVSQFLPIIVADLQLTKQSTLIVAEPEIHLHPNIQAKFADYLIEQINKNQKNYIIETHSEYFLNRLRLAIIKGTLKENDLAVYFLENDGEDVKTHRLDFTKKGEIKNAPKSFFDTYLMDIKNIALSV